MKKFAFIILFMAGTALTAQDNTHNDNLINYNRLNDELNTLIEIPFAVGVYGDYGNFSLGMGIKHYLPINMRLDFGFNLQMVGSDPDFTSVSFSYDVYARGNYSIIGGSKKKYSTVNLKSYSSGYYTTTVEYIRIPMTKYRDLYVHGGYYKQYPGHKLAMGINYSSRSNVKIELVDDNTNKNTRTSTEYFDIGIEFLIAFAYTDYNDNYYVAMGEEAQRFGFNFFTHFTLFGNSMGAFEMRWHSGLLFRLGIGVWIGR